MPTGAARSQLALARTVIRALKVDLPVAQQAVDDRERLLEAGVAMVEGEAEGAVFRRVPAGAEREDQAATADLVDSVGHLGQQRRVAKARAGHQRRQLD